jgi:hypothetical protein
MPVEPTAEPVVAAAAEPVQPGGLGGVAGVEADEALRALLLDPLLDGGGVPDDTGGTRARTPGETPYEQLAPDCTVCSRPGRSALSSGTSTPSPPTSRGLWRHRRRPGSRIPLEDSPAAEPAHPHRVMTLPPGWSTVSRGHWPTRPCGVGRCCGLTDNQNRPGPRTAKRARRGGARTTPTTPRHRPPPCPQQPVRIDVSGP